MLYGSQGQSTKVYEKKNDGWLDYNPDSPTGHWGYDHHLNKNPIADGRPKMIEIEPDPHGGAGMVLEAQNPYHPVKVDIEVPDSFQVAEYPASVSGTHYRQARAGRKSMLAEQQRQKEEKATMLVASESMEAALAPLNRQQAALNREREEVWNELAKVLGRRSMLEYYPGYSDPRYVPTGGYDAPYDLNGDGQYVDNWARVSTDWSCDQPTSGYIYPMPGAPPGARPPVMWKGAGGSGGQMLSGTKPAWTQSPLWSFFTNEGARKIRDQMGGPYLGDETVDNVAPSASYMPPSGVEYQYAPPKRAQNLPDGRGCAEGVVACWGKES